MPEAMLRCLMANIDDLKATVTKQNEQLADLEMRLKTEMKTRERHLTSLIENISQSRSCSCKVGSNETDSLTMEPKKPSKKNKKRKQKGVVEHAVTVENQQRSENGPEIEGDGENEDNSDAEILALNKQPMARQNNSSSNDQRTSTKNNSRTHIITATTEKPSFAPLASDDDSWQLVVAKKTQQTKKGKNGVVHWKHLCRCNSGISD